MTDATDWYDLKFHRELYAGEAVDEAVQRYRKHIEVEMHEQPDVWHLRLRAIKPGPTSRPSGPDLTSRPSGPDLTSRPSGPDRTRRIAHELANYALGLTIQRGGPT